MGVRGSPLLGPALLVPLIEETLFWRSFLIRWLIDPDFLKVPIGRVTPLAAGITSAVFAGSHPEWLPGAPYGTAVGVAALADEVALRVRAEPRGREPVPGIYVVATGDWKYW